MVETKWTIIAKTPARQIAGYAATEPERWG